MGVLLFSGPSIVLGFSWLKDISTSHPTEIAWLCSFKYHDKTFFSFGYSCVHFCTVCKHSLLWFLSSHFSVYLASHSQTKRTGYKQKTDWSVWLAVVESHAVVGHKRHQRPNYGTPTCQHQTMWSYRLLLLYGAWSWCGHRGGWIMDPSWWSDNCSEHAWGHTGVSLSDNNI